MPLINCPECGSDISDRANSCPHCGFPINMVRKYKLIIKGYNDTDTAAMAGLNDVLHLNLDYNEVMNILNNCPYTIAEFDNLEEANINVIKLKRWGLDVQLVNPDGQIEQTINNIVYCPKCGNTNIQAVPKKWSMITGLFTNKVDRMCMNCKYRF